MIISSETVPIPELDIWDFLFEGPRKYPDDKVLFHDLPTGRQYSFLDINNTATSFGQALLTKWSWQEKDVLVTFLPNSIDTPAVTFGTLWAGGIVSPANQNYTVPELVHQLQDSGAKAVVTQSQLLPTVLEAAGRAGIPPNRVLVVGDGKSKDAAHFLDFIDHSHGAKNLKRKSQAHQDIALLVYSSGTTGLSKGVMLSHRNIVANSVNNDSGMSELTSSDVTIGAVPFYHIYGLCTFVVSHIRTGTKCIVMPRFELETFCKAIQDHKITLAYIVPPILLALATSPMVAKYDLSSLRMSISAAAPLNVDLIMAVHKRLNLPTKQAYGLSETSPGVAIQRFEDWNRSPGSSGTLFPNQSLKIASPTGETLPLNTSGEIWIRGPNVFVGYLNNPTATAQAMSADGFYKTGDIGHVDDKHNLWITDRLKELIKYKGSQVAPAELEGVLLGHELVEDVCVLGVYDGKRGTEVPRAYVVRSAGGRAAGRGEEEELEREIVQWMQSRVAKHKWLRGGVRFVDAIPKSAAGKILRRVLRDQMLVEGGEVKAKL